MRSCDIPRILCAATLAAAVGGPALADVAGRVLNSRGEAVVGAHVAAVLPEADGSSITDAAGRFRLRDLEPPAELEVLHPRYETERVAVGVGAAAELEIRLVPKQEIFEEVVVSASRGGGDAPVSINATLVKPDDSPIPPATLTEMISTVPGVAENGQGGIFQNYSVRGISRQRVLTLISGARIVSERRAGVSVSFVDPRLLESVDVLRGPSSSYYGSGALGGVVQLFPRQFEGVTASTGYHGQGDETWRSVGWGDGRWSLGVAHRRAGDSETPDGERLSAGFSQLSGLVERSGSAGELAWQVQALGSGGRDIGKANVDFPERITLYPEEDHLLLRASLRRPGEWRVEAFAHPNRLETRVSERATGDLSVLENEALDFGGNFQKELAFAGGLAARVGVDWFARRGVSAIQRGGGAGGAVPAVSRTLDDAEEDEAGFYAAAEWGAGPATVLAGGRYAWQRQANGGGPSAEDGAWTGFAGLVAPLGSGLELAANLGTGLRFPSLSERFFTGVTGRGDVVANPDLDAERSLALDVGLRWYGESLFLSGSIFRTDIDDYIERIELADGARTFVNLTSGTLEGIEIEGEFLVDEAWSVAFGGHSIEGRDEDGAPLADVPADRMHLGGGWGSGRWRARARWEHRFDKRDPGSAEKPIGAADLLSVSLSFAWRDGLTLQLSGRNLLDESYFNSADEEVPRAAGRSLGVALTWTPGEAATGG